LRILRAVCLLARPASGGASLAFFLIFRHKIKRTDKIKNQFSVQQATVRGGEAARAKTHLWEIYWNVFAFQFFPRVPILSGHYEASFLIPRFCARGTMAKGDLLKLRSKNLWRQNIFSTLANQRKTKKDKWCLLKRNWRSWRILPKEKTLILPSSLLKAKAQRSRAEKFSTRWYRKSTRAKSQSVF